MQIAPLFFFLCLCLSSCGIYNSEFECAPGKGVGCASVGEVMDMIVEQEEGEDLFLKNRGSALLAEKTQKERKEDKLAVVRTDGGELVLVPENQEKKR
jgi:hypothetical protein